MFFISIPSLNKTINNYKLERNFIYDDKLNNKILLDINLDNIKSNENIVSHLDLLNSKYKFYKITLKNDSDIYYTLHINKKNENMPNNEPTDVLIPPKDTIIINGKTAYLKEDDNIYILNNENHTIYGNIKIELTNTKNK